MENFDMTQSVPAATPSLITAGGIILISAFIVFIIVVIKRWKGRFMPALLGVVAYAVFVFIFTELLVSAIAMVPSVDNVFANDPKQQIIIRYFIAAVGYTLARVIMANMLKDRFERPGDVYMAGIGISIGDSLLYGFTAMTNLVWCTAVSTSSVEETLSNFSGSDLESVQSTFQSLMTAPSALWLLLGLSCVIDLVLGIVLMVAVFGAVKKDLPAWTIYATAGVQYAATLAFMLYDETSLVNILLLFAVKLAIAAAAVYYIVKVCGDKISYEEIQ